MNDVQVRPLFGLVEFSEEVVEGSEECLKIKELFDRAGSLDDVINGWMDREKHAGISFVSGTSDFEDTVGEAAVFAVLKMNNRGIASAQCTKEKLVFSLGRDFCVDDANQVFDDEDFSFDRKWVEQRDSVFGIKFNDTYYEEHLPRANVQRLLMSYLGASAITGVELFFPDDDSILDGDIAPEELDEVYEQIKTYVCMEVSVYESAEMRCAISENMAFLL